MNKRLSALIVSLFLVLTGCVSVSNSPPAATATPATTATPAAPATPQPTIYPITLKDAAGRDVTLTAEPKRIISMGPSNTELVFALGKGPALVGRTDYCDYPEQAKAIEAIGGLQPNFEKVISLKPDLILMIGGGVPVRNQLVNDYKLNVFVMDPQDFESLYQGIKALGAVLNTPVQAQTLIADMQKTVKEITDKSATATTKPKVFYEVWHDPLMTAGPKTFIDDMIRLAGGVNAASDAKDQWPMYSLEQLAANNPDIIVTSQDQAAQIKSRNGWEGFKAVKEAKVFGVEDENTIVRPGPRLVQGLKWFAKTIHPELYK